MSNALAHRRPSRSNANEPATSLGAASFLRTALDSLQTNVFIADLDLTLIYINRRGVQTVSTFAGEIQQMFRIGTNELLGGSIHRFHSDPARIERILKDAKNMPHQGMISFGEVRLKANFNHMTDEHGAHVGYVVNWESVAEDEARARVLVTELSAAADTLNSVSQQLSASAEEASAQAGVVAAGAEEMSASIREIAGSATEAATVARDAVDTAAATQRAVSQLGDSSAQIGEVVKLISSIAGQTNLLALNATIEAARAGDAGKGFAVVAQEVKELATQTASATDDIARKVESIQTDVQASTAAIERIAHVINQINDLQNTIASAVEEQTATANEMSLNISGVAQAAAETAQGSTSVMEASVTVSQQSSHIADLLLNGG